MITHPYWGEIDDCFDTVQLFAMPGFQSRAQVSFRNHYSGKDPLTAIELDRHAEVFRAFVDLAPSLMTLIQNECFRYYNEVYADVFERPDLSGEPALGLTTPELHFEKMRRLAGIALARNRSIELDFFYEVDEEHGLAIMFVDNVFYRVGGISDIPPPR